jgi:hypothetical protein
MIINTRTLMQPHLARASAMADVLETIQNIIVTAEGIRTHARLGLGDYMKTRGALGDDEVRWVKRLSASIETIVRTMHHTRVPTTSLLELVTSQLTEITRSVAELGDVLDEKRVKTMKMLVLRIRDDVQTLEHSSLRDTPEQKYSHV